MTLAHHPLRPNELWAAWNPDPLVIGLLMIAAVWYGRGIGLLRSSPRSPIDTRRVIGFYTGLSVSAIALLSPLHALSDTLFSAHMVQHLLLIVCVGPLIVYGAPALPLLLCLPVALRRRLQRIRRHRPSMQALLAAPITAWAFHAIAMWAWHLPTLYEASLRNKIVHGLEHASFLLTAFLVWSIVIPTPKRQPRYAGAIGVMFGTALHSGALGGILTFATAVLYPVHAVGALAWSLTPLEDQQLAGVIMWVPAGAVYFGVVAVLFARWLNESSRADVRDPLVAGTDKR